MTRFAVAVVAGVLALGAGSAWAAQKKPRVGGTVDITQTGGPIPNAEGTTAGNLNSTIEVGGRRFKGTRIRDVNLTFKVTGSGPLAAAQFYATLSSPNGTTISLWPSLGGVGPSGGTAIGPLTLDDESRVTLTNTARDPTMLPDPWQGTAQPDCALLRQGCALSAMDNGRATGTWLLRAFDTSTASNLTNTLDSWRIVVVAGRPFRSKP